jgi:hypothetical protein
VIPSVSWMLIKIVAGVLVGIVLGAAMTFVYLLRANQIARAGKPVGTTKLVVVGIGKDGVELTRRAIKSAEAVAWN